MISAPEYFLVDLGPNQPAGYQECLELVNQKKSELINGAITFAALSGYQYEEPEYSNLFREWFLQPPVLKKGPDGTWMWFF